MKRTLITLSLVLFGVLATAQPTSALQLIPLVHAEVVLGTSPRLIISKLIALGYSKQDIIAALLLDGVDPSTILDPSELGMPAYKSQAFSTSRASSIGGGGHSSVSPN